MGICTILICYYAFSRNGIDNIDRIITTITIQVQTVDGFGIQVGGIVRADEPSPLGTVVSGIAIVEASVTIVVAPVTDDIRSCYIMIIPAPPYFVHNYLFAAKFVHFEG